MAFTTDDPRFIETLRNPVYFRKKRHQEPIILEERFIEFFQDELVSNAFCVDEKGRKVRLNGFVDLKKTYGLPDEVFRKKGGKKSKKKSKEERDRSDTLNDSRKVMGNTLHVRNEPLSTVARNASEEQQQRRDGLETMITAGEEQKMVGLSKKITDKKKFENILSKTSKVIKKVKKPKKISKEALEGFKKQLKEMLGREEEPGGKDGKIHREFTWTISGPDEPRDDDVEHSDDDDDDDDDLDKDTKQEKNSKTKEMTEAEKADMELLTMDLNCATNAIDTRTNDADLTSKRRKAAIEKEVESEVTLEDYQEILTNSRFKNLRGHAACSVEQIRFNAVKKRLLSKK